MRVLVITGTGTGVGKTVVTAAVAATGREDYIVTFPFIRPSKKLFERSRVLRKMFEKFWIPLDFGGNCKPW